MTCPSSVMTMITSPDGAAKGVAALTLLATGEATSAALAWLGIHIAPNAKAIENKNFFMFFSFSKCYTCCGGISLFVFNCKGTKKFD